MDIKEGGLDHPAVAELLHLHLSGMAAISPRESVHALDSTSLGAPGITFWTAWDGTTLLGCGALKSLGGGEGEIKSMRTAPTCLRRGVAAALLEHILSVGRARGYCRLSLET